MKLVLVLAAAMIMACPSWAQTAVTGRSLAVSLASAQVDIRLGFNGADITLFGVKNQPGDIAVVVKGPEQTSVVRHKDKVLGMWMNTGSVEFLNVPVYYDLAVSVPEKDLTSPEMLRKFSIGLDSLDMGIEKNEDADTRSRFREALVRNRQSGGHFPLAPRPVTFISDDFFRADFHVPADVPTGAYRVEVFLFRDGQLIDRRETRLKVAQAGFSARVHDFAYNRSFAYGIISVLFSLAVGGAGHLLFRRPAT